MSWLLNAFDHALLQLSRREHGLAEGRIVAEGPHVCMTLQSKTKVKTVLFQIDPIASESMISTKVFDCFGTTKLYIENIAFDFVRGGACIIAQDLLAEMEAKLTLDFETKKLVLEWS